MTTADWERDNTYYWDNVVFLVENRLYKVPRYYFVKHSEIFGSTFELPQASHPEGQTDEQPFILSGITCLEFDCLLRVIYPMQIHNNTVATMTLQDWKHVLKLSTMYGMVDMRQLAIEHLGKLISSDVIESVVLAKAYEVSAWLKEGYVELVKRIPPLTVEEAQRIGWETAIQIFRVREVALVKQAGNRGYVRYNGTLLDNDVRVHVEREFEEEFAKADAASLRSFYQMCVPYTIHFRSTLSDTSFRIVKKKSYTYTIVSVEVVACGCWSSTMEWKPESSLSSLSSSDEVRPKSSIPWASGSNSQMASCAIWPLLVVSSFFGLGSGFGPALPLGVICDEPVGGGSALGTKTSRRLSGHIMLVSRDRTGISEEATFVSPITEATEGGICWVWRGDCRPEGDFAIGLNPWLAGGGTLTGDFVFEGDGDFGLGD